jgi:hypothetical protein
MERKIPNRSVEEHRAFPVLAFSGEEKTNASLNCQSDSGDGTAKYF